MKTTSLRQFRVAIDKQPEPVQVTRRKDDGTYELLGTWMPAASSAVVLDPAVQRATVPAATTPGATGPAATAPGFGSPHAAPKPSRKR